MALGWTLASAPPLITHPQILIDYSAEWEVERRLYAELGSGSRLTAPTNAYATPPSTPPPPAPTYPSPLKSGTIPPGRSALATTSKALSKSSPGGDKWRKTGGGHWITENVSTSTTPTLTCNWLYSM